MSDSELSDSELDSQDDELMMEHDGGRALEEEEEEEADLELLAELRARACPRP